jgi:undecaprenyl-phosphate 4-deoxy-4-formamido-L-arabinose transferase
MGKVSSDERHPQSISVVIPVFLGESTLRPVVVELARFTEKFVTPGGRAAVVSEIILVYDNGPDDSASVIRELELELPFVRAVWLTRNFGQHAATIAGMASSGSDWIVTMDEDGQHDPADIPAMLDAALDGGQHVIYAAPTNRPPHSWCRRTSSRIAKALMSVLFTDKRNSPIDYQSYRLILGEVGRSVAAYAGSGAYLDIALGWVTNRVGTVPVELRAEQRGASGYSYRSLGGHFWRMILSSGTKGLRLVSVLGALLALAGIGLAVFFVIVQLTGGSLPQGWTSLMTVALLSSGTVLISLGIIAEYLGIAVNMAMGKPLYMIMNDPKKGPLGRRLEK